MHQIGAPGGGAAPAARAQAGRARSRRGGGPASRAARRTGGEGEGWGAARGAAGGRAGAGSSVRTGVRVGLWAAQRGRCAPAASPLRPLGPRALGPRWVGRLRAPSRAREAHDGQRTSAADRQPAPPWAPPPPAPRASHEVCCHNDDAARSGARSLHESLCIWTPPLTWNQQRCNTFQLGVRPLKNITEDVMIYQILGSAERQGGPL